MLELMAGNARRRTVILSLNVAIGVALLFATPRSVLQPKAAQCNPPAFLHAGDPAYVDAMELAQTLRTRGFTVKCVLRSTMEGAFEGLEGAALYRTDRGDFEALFLPKPQTFAGVIVTEEQQNGRYVYSFHGTPRPWLANRVDSLRPISFLWRANQFLVIRDDHLRVKLEEVLNP